MTWTSDEAVARANAVIAAAQRHGLPVTVSIIAHPLDGPHRRLDEPPPSSIDARVTCGRHPLWMTVPSAHGRWETWADSQDGDGTADVEERVAACARLLR